MKIEITQRMNNILDILLKEKEITLQDLSRELNLSIRQIRYDISKINECIDTKQDSPCIIMNHKGYIKIKDRIILQRLYHPNTISYKFSQQQRINFLSVISAFHISELNLSHLSDVLDITRSTIKNDIRILKAKLSEYNLNLVYEQVFELKGTDRNLFRYRIECLQNLEYTLFKEHFDKIEKLIFQYIIPTFPLTSLRSIFPIIINFYKANDVHFNDRELYWLASSMITVLWYNKNHKKLPRVRLTPKEPMSYDFDTFFYELQNISKIRFSTFEQAFIKNIIYSIQYPKNKNIKNVNKEIIKYIVQMINQMEEPYYSYFKKDTFLMEALYYHLSAFYNRKQMNINIPILNKYAISFDSKLQHYIQSFVEEHQNIIAIKDKNELNLLLLHFANSLNLHIQSEIKKVLLVTGLSEQYQEALAKQLEENFEIKIIDMISRYELPFYDMKEADILLFSEDIPQYLSTSIPMLKISLFLNIDDFIKLYHLGITPRRIEINFNKLYEDMDFLKSSERIKTIKYLNNHIFHKNVIVGGLDNSNCLIEETCFEPNTQWFWKYNFFHIQFDLDKTNTIFYQQTKDNTYILIHSVNIGELCKSIISCLAFIQKIQK